MNKVRRSVIKKLFAAVPVTKSPDLLQNLRYRSRLLVLLVFVTQSYFAPLNFAAETPSPPELTRLKYNNPGLVVDLGVGLWAWPLPMDFDGDGDPDLVVNCPDKPYNGVYFFENASDTTSAGKMPIFLKARRISIGLQNVQVSYVGGRPVVMSPGTVYPDFLKTGLEHGRQLPLPANIHPNKVRANMWRSVDYEGDGNQDIIVGAGDWTEYGWDNAYDASGTWTNGPLRGFVYLVRNAGTDTEPQYESPVKVMAGDHPAEVFGWPSPSFSDFDNDGDLDLLCGEFLDGFTYFQNVGNRTAPRYSAGIRLKQTSDLPLTMDLQMITPTAFDWDHDGDQDLIVGDEDGRVAFIEHTGMIRVDGAPQFLAPKYFQQEAEDLKCGALATPVGCDWDGDGDTDIVSGNTAGYIQLFRNLSGPGVEHPQWAAPEYLQADGNVIRIQAGPNGSIQGPCEAKWGYTTLSVADWDSDGLLDIVASSILGKVHWYRNRGTRTAALLTSAQPVDVEWNGSQPELSYGWMKPRGKQLLTQWRTTPVAADWNRDGLTDLIMLDHEGFLAYFERFRQGEQLLLKAPRRMFSGDNFSVTDSRHKVVNSQTGLIQLNHGIAGRSGRRKLTVVDWDQDGKLDILANAANAVFLRQTRSTEDLVYLTDTGLLVNQNIEGHDVSPAVVDFNGDGTPDFLGGAEDGRFYYLRNPHSPDPRRN
jgi:hypothetical protein